MDIQTTAILIAGAIGLFGNILLSGAIYFRLGAHSARHDSHDRRLTKLEARPSWIG